MKDILERLANSDSCESSVVLKLRCWDAAEEISRLRDAIRKTLEENSHLADGENCTLIRLNRALGIEQCKKCGADMQNGVAIGQTFTGLPDFFDGVVCTISPGGSGKIIECKKCPECGWSVTK